MGTDRLSPRAREHLELFETERKMVPVPHALEGDLPAETPIEPGCTVRLSLARYHPDDGWGPETGPSGVVAALNYGRAENEERNHWRYHVVWAQESWEFERPATGARSEMPAYAWAADPMTMAFSSDRGTMGWPHLWRHDYLDVVRDPWAVTDDPTCQECGEPVPPERGVAVPDEGADGEPSFYCRECGLDAAVTAHLLGRTRDEVRFWLGEPDHKGGTSRKHPEPAIWLYRSWEVAFDREGHVHLLFDDPDKGGSGSTIKSEK